MPNYTYLGNSAMAVTGYGVVRPSPNPITLNGTEPELLANPSLFKLNTNPLVPALADATKDDITPAEQSALLGAMGVSSLNTANTYAAIDASGSATAIAGAAGKVAGWDTLGNPAALTALIGSGRTANATLVTDSSGNVVDQAGLPLSNPMTAAGSLIVGGVNGAPAELLKGAPLQNLRVNAGGTGLEYADPSAGGSPAQVTTYATAGTFTWTKPANAKAHRVRLIGAGAGAGSGRRGAAGTVRCGGGGGGTGGFSEMMFLDAQLPATVSVTVGSKGLGGAAVTADDTNGNNGTAGGDSLFGAYLRAVGGGAGGGGTNAAGTAGTAGAGLTQSGNAGAAASTTGGPGATAAQVSVGTPGGSSGGGITSADVANNGAWGRGSATLLDNGATAGTTYSTNANAIPGQLWSAGPGSGNASITAAAGDGGNGAGHGGAGSGGGASLNGHNSGKGGDGTDGYVEIVSFF